MFGAASCANWGHPIIQGESLALVSRVVVFSNDYSVVKHSECLGAIWVVHKNKKNMMDIN